MQYCKNCRLHIKGNRERCPLCQGGLSGKGDPEQEDFPKIPTIYQQHNLLIRLAAFLSVAISAICVAINIILPGSRFWSFFVVAAILCMWLSAVNVLIRHRNLPKCVVWQVVLLSLMALAWDYLTRWRGWSVDYAIPAICVIAMLFLLVLGWIKHTRIEEYMIYLILDGVVGIVPLIFILTGWVQVLWPSVICITVSVICFAALLSFSDRAFRAELRKRLHL